MTKLNGISANFASVAGLYGVQKTETTTTQATTETTSQTKTTDQTQRKSPDEILTSMHNYGVQKLVSRRIESMKTDSQMQKRIAVFMESFEQEVKKSLEVIAKDFPEMDESQSLEIAAKAALSQADS